MHDEPARDPAPEAQPVVGEVLGAEVELRARRQARFGSIAAIRGAAIATGRPTGDAGVAPGALES